jgi:bifunctional lysine-specific demethylase and histidyl-hydroxylase NO66
MTMADEALTNFESQESDLPAVKSNSPAFSLASGISPTEFFRNYWGKYPILFPKPLSQVLEKYSIRKFEERIAESDVRYPTVGLAQNGDRINPARFTYSRKVGGVSVDDLIDVPSVYRLWDQGHTIILHSLQYSAPSLFDWLETIEAQLRHPIQANAYLSPPESQGFGIHYDTHDVFIVQVEGRKHWRVWKEPAYPAPLSHENRAKDPGMDGRPTVIDRVIEPGEIIYIPRGFYHEARSVESASLHLTLGVLLLRRFDGLKAIFEKITADVEKSTNDSWRAALSPEYLEGSEPEFMALRDEIIARLKDAWSVSPISERFHSRPRLLPHISLGERHSLQLRPDSKLKVASPLIPHIVQQGSELRVKYSGQSLTLPVATKSALDRIFTWRTFKPEDLSDYNIDSAVLLCRHLVTSGILTICE